MATRSAEFLEVDEFERVPSLHRSRSGGYVDHLEEQTQWDRRDRERQMKRYHDNRHRQQEGQPGDRLYVPTFDTIGHRRARSYDEMAEKREEPARSYLVREERPRTSYDLSDQSASPGQLTVRSPPEQRQRKPSIKVQIHQDESPSQAAARKTPGKSASMSPRSPNVQPQLLYQYTTLQSKFAELGTICSRYIDVEAADPQDLTFEQIAEQIQGFGFELQVWSHVVNLDNMARIEVTKRAHVEAASLVLDRLIDRVGGLCHACAKAKPRDLRFEPLSDAGELDESESSGDEAEETSAMEGFPSVGFVIESHLKGIQLQMKTLKRLARALQEATLDAKDEVVAVGKLVDEAGRYFGSQAAVDRYSIDPKFAGKKALHEARYAGGSR